MSDTHDGHPAAPEHTPRPEGAAAHPQTPLSTGSAPTSASAPRIPPMPQSMPPGYGPAAPRPPYAQTAPYGTRPAGGAAPAFAGTAFGPAADTQPTLPLGPAGQHFGAPANPHTGAVQAQTPSAAKAKVGAGRVAALLVAAALVGGAAGLGGAYAGVQLAGPASQQSTVTSGGGTVVVNDTDSVTQTTGIAAKVMPSVVTISVSANGSGGTGSGVILTDDGYVVTNTHVVTLDGASADGAIRVTTSDGRIFSAEIVGLDPIYDLAVIKLVDAEGLTPIELASSADLNVGDVTVAIGAPLGLANTVTAGIVSALGRSIEIASSAVPESASPEADDDAESDQEQEGGPGSGPFQFDIPGQNPQTATGETIKIAVVQTDAAINPGNSGGALVDSDGKLIGINVAIATAGSSEGSGNIGVGFSIPSDIVKRVTDEIIEDGEAAQGPLGASVRSAAAQENATIAGAYIQEVTEDGAAAAAGLRQGDVVTAFNGVTVGDSVDLTALVRAEAAGSDATVTFVRDGTSQSVEVILGTLTS